MKRKPKKSKIHYITKNIVLTLGVVLVWRGVWYILDQLDIMFLGGNHIWSAVIGFVIGLLILYIPDKDLKEIEKL